VSSVVTYRRIGTVLGLALLWLSCADAAIDATTPPPFTGRGVERGVVSIRCSVAAGNLVRFSRGSVLDVAALGATRDIVLTAAHGLLDTRDAVRARCRVLGERGRTYRIRDVWRGAAGGSDTASDWAVLLVDGRLDGTVGRLRPASFGGNAWRQLEATGAAVRLVLREADAGAGDCRLRQPTGSYDYSPRDLVLYSCPGSPDRSRAPGLSGSPIVTGVDGRAAVVGIHLGWGLQFFEDGRFHAVSIGRPIDADVAAAIGAAAAATRR
jgi:hypothetical protein